jgi:hypothetical protein
MQQGATARTRFLIEFAQFSWKMVSNLTNGRDDLPVELLLLRNKLDAARPPRAPGRPQRCSK